MYRYGRTCVPKAGVYLWPRHWMIQKHSRTPFIYCTYILSTFFVCLFNGQYCSNFRNAIVKKTKTHPWAFVLVHVRAMKKVCPKKCCQETEKGPLTQPGLQLRMRENFLDEMIYPGREEVRGAWVRHTSSNEVTDIYFLKAKTRVLWSCIFPLYRWSDITFPVRK